ncbi:two component transcriptional regulator, LuxR family [Novosphingobium sp. CF614]|uniref:response regulator n=1 Tax=Novosphingobium sp. CF614 TaxID=1884364 RepID=UPI0008F02387|nr:response regulator [Novosphingobium sp. CF614]SFG31030.1 two component transcriptional regulator, LuxR family [Novosphingobium sp. CF614]
MTATILIVDDDADTRAMLATFVLSLGSTPMLAPGGAEALASLDVAVPDLILLDAVMPGLDGFDTCRRLKADPRAGAVPVIFMTGLSDTGHVVMGLEAGGVDYVTKPLVLDELSARIRVHLGNARKARSALTGLESVGARLFACDAQGEIVWTTPQAQDLLRTMSRASGEELRSRLLASPSNSADHAVTLGPAGDRYVLTHLGQAGEQEALFKIAPSSEGREAEILRRHFGLTPREADVLLWIARGKSNRDMSDILNISARTVNKHLEQIFIKIGVENRASAAAVATRALFSP